MTCSQPRRCCAFALPELVTLLVLAAVVAAILTLAAHDHRRAARLGEDAGKLRRIGGLTSQYANDNADQFWTFSWRKGQALSKYADLNNATDDNQAAANQAVDFLKRHGRDDIFNITAWHPHRTYSQFALQDSYAGVADAVFISAGDRSRLLWSRDPKGFDAGLYSPVPSNPAPPQNNAKRWPYSGSFQLGAAFYDKAPPLSRASQSSTHAHWSVPMTAILGPHTLAEVAYPSHKVHVSDGHARHFATAQPFATHDQARLPLLFVDASVMVRAAAEANKGWHPNSPSSAGPSSFVYQPDVWEPPTVSGQPSEPVIGRYLWTRGTPELHGFVGRDFGGPEVYIPPP